MTNKVEGAVPDRIDSKASRAVIHREERLFPTLAGEASRVLGGFREKIFAEKATPESQIELLEASVAVSDHFADFIIATTFYGEDPTSDATLGKLKRELATHREKFGVSIHSGTGGAALKDYQLARALMPWYANDIDYAIEKRILELQRLNSKFDVDSLTQPNVLICGPLSDYLELRLIERALIEHRRNSFSTLPVGVDFDKNSNTVVFLKPETAAGKRVIIWDDNRPLETVTAMHIAGQRLLPTGTEIISGVDDLQMVEAGIARHIQWMKWKKAHGE